MTSFETSGAILTIDVNAIVANWRALRARLRPGAVCGAVVKADAYGTGASVVGPALARAGCTDFFVATLDEAVSLRGVLAGPSVHVLGGLMAGCEDVYAHHDLTPVLNSLAQIEAWGAFCRSQGGGLVCDVHIDTGMSRLGLPADELAVLADDPARWQGLSIAHVMSHLVSAEEPENPVNAQQLVDFNTARAIFGGIRGSLCNSSGIFLGADYHADLVRPGVALYGANPTPGQPNPMAQVVRLQGKILQVRSIDTPQTVGYGASHAVDGPTRIATVAVGYADGYLRSGSNKACGFIGEVRTPVVGRISMDLTTVDVSALPEGVAVPGAWVDLIGPHNPLDALADAAGTIAYEILTDLGPRYHRVYVGDTLNGDAG